MINIKSEYRVDNIEDNHYLMLTMVGSKENEFVADNIFSACVNITDWNKYSNSEKNRTLLSMFICILDNFYPF